MYEAAAATSAAIVTAEKKTKIHSQDVIDPIYLPTKGQMISECPYEIIVSPKIPTKKFPRFLP